MITREQVADLQPGDVVELRDERWPEGTALRGPVWDDAFGLAVGWFYLRKDANDHHTLTIVSRAPRSLYTNSRRALPAQGDIVRDCDGDAWRFDCGEWWCASSEACDEDDPDCLPIEQYRPLTLLWDGQTGQVVQ